MITKDGQIKETPKQMAIEILHESMLQSLDYWTEGGHLQIGPLTDRERELINKAIDKEVTAFEKKHKTRLGL